MKQEANSESTMNIQWYPGHMTKTRRMIEADVKLVDAVCEILDARIPLASRNPDIDRLAGDKPRIVVLNRTDLADPKATARWHAAFQRQGMTVLETDSRSGKGVNGFAGAVRTALRDKIEAYAAKGQVGRPMRVMVLGIPNVGKSTFINSYAGKACAKTGNKPGVTKGKQWIRLNKTLELLDTPGILWPKFEDQEVGKRLAFIGSIKDEILNLEELSLELLDYIRTNYPGLLNTRYGIEEEGTPVSLLEAVADKRKCLIRGQEIDYAKAAGIVMEEFRNGKIGRITLEFPPVEEETAHEDHPGD